MTIWWCKEHRAAESAEEDTCEVAAVLWNFSTPAACRLVQMRLIGVDE